MKRHWPSMTDQRGMAIISALLIVTVVAVIATGMLARQGVFTRALEAEQSRVHGSQVLLGGLETGRRLLWISSQRDALTRLDQPWNQPIHPPRLNDGFEGRLEDQQGKFNLRNVLSNERIDRGQLRSFERLCEMIGIDAGLAARISARMIASYAYFPDDARQPLPASQPMLNHLGDLRGIAGIDEVLLARLGRYVSIIPANTWVNGNTASAEVLAAVVPGLSLAQATALVQERDRGQWFINRGDFVNRLQLPHVTVDGLNVGISSEWFLFHGQARQDRRRGSLQALLHRVQNDMPRVIWSRQGV
ncbi:type II secretion system minor pseudopilin GspK [Pseudomonas sp. 3A(2025)]